MTGLARLCGTQPATVATPRMTAIVGISSQECQGWRGANLSAVAAHHECHEERELATPGRRKLTGTIESPEFRGRVAVGRSRKHSGSERH